MSAALDLHPDAGHPALAGAVAVGEVLDGLDVAGTPLGSGDHASAVAAWRRIRHRVEAIELALLAAADAAEVAADAGLASTGDWVRRHTHTDAPAAARQVALAGSLATDLPATATAMGHGEVSGEHARVIAHAIDQLPTDLDPGDVTAVEERLVEQARTHDPTQLRRLARRALEAIESDPTRLRAAEDAALRAEEHTALEKTRLTLHENGDGTLTGHFTVPALAGEILRKTIQAMTAPRRARPGATEAHAGPAIDRADWSRRAGQALVELLEHLPTDHLHHKAAATIVVHLDWTTLREAVGAATTDTTTDLSAAQVRRLACNAGILPAILDGDSLPLDLGRTHRLFNPTQRLALSTRHRTCAAQDCQRPYAWCELHHHHPWHTGGPTNLDHAIPLCHWHHQRIHDPTYTHQRHPDGTISFHRQRC